MERVSDWRKRYDEAIDAVRTDAFQWGTHDCLAGLVVPVLRAITGNDYFTAYIGKYKTERGALGVMHRAGFDNLADLAASELTEVHPSQMQMGDVAAIPADNEFGFALGICNGERIFVMHPDGLGTRDRSEATRGFQVI